MTLLIAAAFLATAIACLRVGIAIGRASGRREQRSRGEMIYG